MAVTREHDRERRARTDEPAAAEPAPEPLHGHAALLALQRTAGNRAVSDLVAPRALVAREEGVVEMDPVTVVAGTGDFFDNVRDTMRHVSTRLAANAGNYGVEVLNACESFKTYANTKIADLDGEITGEELAGALVGAALTFVGGQLTGQIANEALKFVAEQVADAVKGKLEEAATSAATNDSDEEALKASIDGITQRARDCQTTARREAQSAIDSAFAPIFDKCNARETLSPSEDELVMPFWGVGMEAMDREIERSYGIPSVPSAAVAQVELFRGLVEEFERIYIGRTASLRESLEMTNFEMIPGADRSRSLPGRARTAAGAAAGTRAGELGLSWRDFAAAGRSYDDAVAAGMDPPSQEEYERVRTEAEFGG